MKKLSSVELDNALLSSNPTLSALAQEVAEHRADVSQLREPPRPSVSAKELAHQWFGNRAPRWDRRMAEVASLASLIARVRKETARQIARLVQEGEKMAAVNRVQKEWIDFNGPRLVALTELVRDCRAQLGGVDKKLAKLLGRGS